ncbi:MAG: sigma-70 family RNA polymerase sigma factor [Eubacteriaceae bacterium]|nr:sigma-70 family RNA polymerase sigma factor [Eubacteriaceae bacterium]
MTTLDYDYLAKLVVKSRTGDSDAFAELYTATYSKQYRYAYQYVKDPNLAQDIIQEVYILVLRNLDALKDPRLFVSWLNQITFRVCYNFKTRLAMRNEEEISLEMQKNTDSFFGRELSPEEKVSLKYERTELMKCVLDLQPKEAQAIIMRYYNNMTIEDIADAMDCSRSTVKRRLAAGKANLRKKVKNYEWGGVFSD